MTDSVLAFVTVNLTTLLYGLIKASFKEPKRNEHGSRFLIDASDDNCENGFIISNFP